MRISVYQVPAEFADLTFDGMNAVVIDVLRACSSIVAALENGCRQILPVATVEEAFSLSGQFAPGQVLLAGERDGRRVQGFDLGNSPAEYTTERVYGKTLILSTTNGTRALVRAESAVSTRVLALTNLSAVCQALLADNRPVAVLCSGRNGEFSLEDTVCAGLLTEKLGAASGDSDLNDGAEQAVELARAHKNNLLGMLRSCPHGRYLESIGFGLDLEYCARLNASNSAPVMRDGSIALPSTRALLD